MELCEDSIVRAVVLKFFTAFLSRRDEVRCHVGPHGPWGFGLDSARSRGADGRHSVLREA